MIYYFESVYKKIVCAPVAKRLKAIVFNSVPRSSVEGCKPFFEVTNNLDDNLLYTNKFDQNLRFYFADYEEAMSFEFKEGNEPILHGDVQFVFKHRGVLTDSAICRIAFNTAFIPPNNTLVFKKHTVSPDSFKKDSRIREDFLIQFIFEDYCSECTAPWQMSLD